MFDVQRKSSGSLAEFQRRLGRGFSADYIIHIHSASPILGINSDGLTVLSNPITFTSPPYLLVNLPSVLPFR